MPKRLDLRKRKEIQDVGMAALDFPFHTGKGALSIAVSLLFISVVIGAVHKNMRAVAVEENVDSEKNFESAPSMLPMTIEELLQEMAKRLNLEKVVSKARIEKRILRVFADAPMFPLSKDSIVETKQKQLEIVADTLAWAIHCHLSFSGSTVSQAAKNALKQCGIVDSERYKCIPGKGRVDIAGIRFDGHADSVPFKTFKDVAHDTRRFKNNQELSEARAVEFANKVVGCAQAKLSKLGAAIDIPHDVRGMSDFSPAETDGRDPKNRRVEIHFDESSGSVHVDK